MTPERAWEWAVVTVLVVIAFSALAYMISSSGTIN